MKQVKFPLGRLMATPGLLRAVPHHEMIAAIARHQSGDWGDVVPDDHAANEQALAHGERLFSVYHSSTRIKFWIITE